MEPELRNANIHSFGYDSDWASMKSSILNLHDFGQSLLEEMRNSPYLRDKGNVRLEDLYHNEHSLNLTGTYSTDWAFHGGTRHKEGKSFSC